MKILISSCLLGNNTKYNGGNNYNPELLESLNKFELIPVCPEVDGGLSTPRNPSEIINDQVISSVGVDVTANYLAGAKHALELCLMNNIKYAILKAKSPSCGCGKIYDGTFSHKLTLGDGVTTKMLKEAGIEVYTEENYVELLKNISK